MTEEPESIEGKASREATDWLILLQDDPDDHELAQRFEDWLNQSPLHRDAWAATEHTAGLIGSAAPAHAQRWAPHASIRDRVGSAAQPARAHPASKARQNRRPGQRHRQRGLTAAVVAVAACIAAIIVLPDLALRLQADHATGTGEIRQINLTDGSVVVLAPGSAVRVDDGPASRRVELLEGEAFFEVEPDPRRPFTVAARDVRTVVLGTAFNVRRGEDAATVALQHGRVLVERDSAASPVSETLLPGEYLSVGWAGGAVNGRIAPDQIAAWRNGLLIAEDQPMRAVVDRLRGYYDGVIFVTDDALADRAVTGVYNLADPVGALRGIARAHDATVRQITPWILVVSGS